MLFIGNIIRRKNFYALLIATAIFIGLVGRLCYLMINKEEYYSDKAKDVHQRERTIVAERGTIYDRNLIALTYNRNVYEISVINSQITDADKVVKVLTKELCLDEAEVSNKVNRKTSIQRIKTKVDADVANRIRSYNLDGVVIDEGYTREYPYGKLGSKVIGFTGSDNQGVIGLEVKYDRYLKGVNGKLLTYTTATGLEVDNKALERKDPIDGYHLVTTLDYNIMCVAQQLADRTLEAKEAKSVKIIVMNPQNGEILACVNAPEFDLNNPYDNMNSLLSNEDNMKLLNETWRNNSISDTYEPGSIFKIVTAAAALDEQKVSLEERFFCSGSLLVEDRKIRCAKVAGHGSQSFVEGVMNSCNPVFMEIGLRVGAADMYKYYHRLGLFRKTGIDLPGEANSIMHKLENIGAVELATMSFGQSIQITPFQMLVAASGIINDGRIITPHFAKAIVDDGGNTIAAFDYEIREGMITTDTSRKMRMILEKVVSEGTGNKAYIEGYSIGGKTATSQKLPRGNGKYIASFLGFSPAESPTVMAIVLIDEPSGNYYGGSVAAPVIRELFENILPYMGIDNLQ